MKPRKIHNNNKLTIKPTSFLIKSSHGSVYWAELQKKQPFVACFVSNLAFKCSKTFVCCILYSQNILNQRRLRGWYICFLNQNFTSYYQSQATWVGFEFFAPKLPTSLDCTLSSKESQDSTVTVGQTAQFSCLGICSSSCQKGFASLNWIQVTLHNFWETQRPPADAGISLYCFLIFFIRQNLEDVPTNIL